VTPSQRPPIRLLVFAASLRAESINARLAQLAAAVIETNGATADLASMHDFDVPIYDGDLEMAEGVPAGARSFHDRLEACDGFVIASPEYNGSMPGGLKNLVDWVSRLRPQPFVERHCLLMSASPSMVGGNRGLWALRVPLEHLGTRVYPDMFSLAQAHTAFDEHGRLADDQLRQRFETTIVKFLDLVEASTHYPCVKREWVEFLGERPDPAVDRVEPGAPAVT
jgi:NAD(P)H-dependent FMN reductase